MIEGLTELALFKGNKKVDEVIKHNTITSYPQNLLTKGNWNWCIRRDFVSPFRQFFQGCFLTDEENDPDLGMLAYNSEIVAQASSSAYTGTNTKRGSYNANESGPVANGYKFVWDWTTSQGNGDIKSVCLTRAASGRVFYSDSEVPTNDSNFINEILSDHLGDRQRYSTAYTASVIDWEKERSYEFVYDSSVPEFIINEYAVVTKYLRLNGSQDYFKLIATHHIALDGPATGDNRASSVTYTGDAIHYIQKYSPDASSLTDYVIDLSTWTATKIVHTYENLTFAFNISNWDNPRDAVLIKNGYFYTGILMGGKAKFGKLSMTNHADVITYDYPFSFGNSEDERARSLNTPKMLLPNGDIYFPTSSGKAFYFHNDKLYMAPYTYNYNTFSAFPAANKYGSTFTTTGDGLYICTLAPFVSTVNNLGRTVSKTNDLTMKLTYTITEVEE